MPFEDVPDVVRKRMSRIRKTGSKPEVLVRKVTYRLGFRFRINRSDLPGTPDIVFPRRRKMIFVHGCFWHQHSGCRNATIPRVREGYWLPKLERTKARDIWSAAQLRALGWSVMTVWECEVRDEAALEATLRDFLVD